MLGQAAQRVQDTYPGQGREHSDFLGTKVLNLLASRGLGLIFSRGFKQWAGE